MAVSPWCPLNFRYLFNRTRINYFNILKTTRRISLPVFAPIKKGRKMKKLWSLHWSQTGGNADAFKAGSKYEGLISDFGEPAMANSFQFDAVLPSRSSRRRATRRWQTATVPSPKLRGLSTTTLPPTDRLTGPFRPATKSLDSETRQGSNCTICQCGGPN